MPLGPTAKEIYFSGRDPKNQISSAIAPPTRGMVQPHNHLYSAKTKIGIFCPDQYKMNCAPKVGHKKLLG